TREPQSIEALACARDGCHATNQSNSTQGENMFSEAGKQTEEATMKLLHTCYAALLLLLGTSSFLLIASCGGGGGTPPVTYTIGGGISGLTVSGLVLANGNDTMSPSAWATSFVFSTAVASGVSYAVTVKTQPNNELCQVVNGNGQVASAAVTNVMV